MTILESEGNSPRTETVPCALRQLLLYFLGLGTTGFGGPIALCGYMQRDLVEKRRWISKEDYTDGLHPSFLDPAGLCPFVLTPYRTWVQYTPQKEGAMAHTIRHKTKLLDRARRIRGQVEAVEKGLLKEQDCHTILHTIAACRGAINGLMTEVIEGHIRLHIVDPDRKPTSEQARATQELIDVLQSYLK
ncbi:MAG: metal-sensing transcriptional repressor [Planctomycetes bacterium]|nr:metal-sensing transcriptional repressor [Planctomycetota bacterium]